MNGREFQRVARILRREACHIRAQFALGRRAWWTPHLADQSWKNYVAAAKADHDEMLDLARKLAAHAKECAA
jgi:hypothetical protein